MSRSYRESSCPFERCKDGRAGTNGVEKLPSDSIGLCLPLQRIPGRTLLKPLLVPWSSNDVSVFDRFLLQILHIRGLAKTFDIQEGPIVCLSPFRPIFVDSTRTPDGKKSSDETIKTVWQISPDSVRLYVEDLVSQPPLLENFIARTRALGLTELRCYVVQKELCTILDLLDVAVTDDLLRVLSEKGHLDREKRRQQRYVGIRQAALDAVKRRRTEATGTGVDPTCPLAGIGTNTGRRRSGPASIEECLPLCKDLIIIGISLGKLMEQRAETDSIGRCRSDDDRRPGRGRKDETGRRRSGAGTGGSTLIGDGDYGAGVTALPPLDGFSDTGLLTAMVGKPEKKGSAKRLRKKPKSDDDAKGDRRKGKKSARDKKGKEGRGGEEFGGIEDLGGRENEEEEKQEEEYDLEDDDDDDGVYRAGGGGGEGEDEDAGLADEEEEMDFREFQLSLYELETTDTVPLPPSTHAIQRRSFLFGREFSRPPARSTMYSLEFTPAFVFSYFPTMPPHYFDKQQLLLFLAKKKLRDSKYK